ncbi:MAG TPA: hypothetical protein VF518_00840 [Polyangia bacterium]
MKNLLGSALIALLATCAFIAPAQADDNRPTVFTFAYQGLVVGAGAGLAGGYLVARDNGWQSSDWKPLVYGAGIGSLAGAGVGLIVGVVDVAQDKPGHARYVMRDMSLGVGFGATVGAIAGGLAAISTKKPEHILLGGSIGILSGAVLGAVFGFFEGGSSHRAGLDNDNRRLALSVVPVAEAGGKLTYLPALSGRY